MALKIGITCYPTYGGSGIVATELGIPVSTGVSNSPVAPAELTLALIVASRRNVALEAERMKRGEWPCTLSHRLRGSTLGIFGLGAIGQLVAEGGRGLGMDILVWGQENSLKQAAAKGYARAASKSELFERSDVLSLHVRLTRETRGIVAADDLARMNISATTLFPGLDGFARSLHFFVGMQSAYDSKEDD